MTFCIAIGRCPLLLREVPEKSHGETFAVRKLLAATEAQRDCLISDLVAANAAMTSARADGGYSLGEEC